MSNRSEKRKTKRTKIKVNKRKNKKREEASFNERIFILLIGVAFIMGSLYLGFRKTDIVDNELSKIIVVLSEKPSYEEYEDEGATYRDVYLVADGYQAIFNITAKVYKATKHHYVHSLSKGDAVIMSPLRKQTKSKKFILALFSFYSIN